MGKRLQAPRGCGFPNDIYVSQKMTVDSKSNIVSDLGAGQHQETRSEQIENAVGFLSHPKVCFPFETMIQYLN